MPAGDPTASVQPWLSTSEPEPLARAFGYVRPGPDAELGLLRQSRAIERFFRERGIALDGLLRGLDAARQRGTRPGRPAVADRPELRERIRMLRTDGWTLQAIADELNADGVPTLRGGAEWRPSSVQSAAGYKRPDRGGGLDGLPGNAALPARTDALEPGRAARTRVYAMERLRTPGLAELPLQFRSK